MTADKQLKLAVLVSGRGSNLQALIRASRENRMDAHIVLVVSDNPTAPALERAKAESIPTAVIRRSDYGSRKEFDGALADTVEKSGAKLVCLAGFMKILSSAFLDRFPGAVINIHPALLPSFPGLDAQKQALEHGVKITGCTVHYVDRGVDTGPVILQSAVNVEPDDTLETLSARILEREHIIYPTAIQLIATGAVKRNQAPKETSVNR